MSATPVGVVVIGRNEGERLLRCLRSVLGESRLVVYIDSNSTDDSVAQARALGAQVVVLDPAQPFTAARARNEGLREMLRHQPDASYVQFVDGDCEVIASWIPAALACLESHPDVAIACGRRRERFPQASVYNELCDFEWDTPIGEAKGCGGDALMRVRAMQQVGGYRDSMIAGEDTEMCVRIRAAGWKIWRLPEEMTLHDAAMTRFSQWVKRTMRSGYAFAEGMTLHGATPERFWVRECTSVGVWGLAVPLLALAACLAWGSAGLLLLLVYPLQVMRQFLKTAGAFKSRLARAATLVGGNLPQAAGLLKYYLYRAKGARSPIIEYK